LAIPLGEGGVVVKIFMILLLATAAIAQTSSSSGSGSGGAIIVTPSGARLGATLEPTTHGQAVVGDPYSAVEITEHVQTLADGTHITQPAQKVTFYRDSQGRTRVERSSLSPLGASAVADAGPSFVEISDPVSGVRYTLDVRNHTARKIVARFADPPPQRQNVVPGSASGKVVPANRAILSSDQQQLRPQFSTESLGTQIIEGVLAEGTRTTVVYPVGFMGNDRPITTISETWTSAELKRTVLSKNSDPRSGESTTRLTNISRAEPDPSLFQAPSDYEVVDVPPTPQVR
jgi:hypothetical protein